MNDRVCRDSDRLRNPERLARLEVDRVVGLCLEIPGIRSVLDVGTGTGVFAEAFSARSLTVTGIDIQETMLAQARVHVPGARFLIAPSERMPFEDRVFDLVFMGLVLHETEDPLATLKEAARVCGRLAAALEWRYEEQPFGPPLGDRLEESRVRELSREAGFSFCQTVSLAALNLYLFYK